MQILWPFAATNLSAYPYANVIEGSDGMLYGTTYGGNTADVGAVFKLDKAGSTLTFLHRFTSSEGDTPAAPVIEATNGVLYGTTSYDVTNSSGSIFKINKDGSGFAVLHRFTSATNDGGGPFSALLQASDGTLYGTAQYGGVAPFGGDGVVFSMDLAGSNFMILHSFTGPDGTAPQDSLIEGTNGALYGTALNGGTNDWGTVFRLDKNGSNFIVIHYFGGGSNGFAPYANLYKAPNGKLYGTTISGGTNNHGVLFSLDYDGGNYTVLHHFGAFGDGADVYAGVGQGPDGALYGATYDGNNNFGTLYQINLDGSGYTVLLRFASTNGANPNGMIASPDGAFYGTCNYGGGPAPLGRGTVFKLTGIVPLSDTNVLNAPFNLLTNGWRVSGRGVANRSYTIQFATNLAAPVLWSNIGTATADSSGNWHLDGISNSASRFFRSAYP